MPTNRQLITHLLSTQVNTIFRLAYREDKHSEETAHLLEAMKELRRALPVVDQDKSNRNRHKYYKNFVDHCHTDMICPLCGFEITEDEVHIDANITVYHRSCFNE